uniref:Endopeptidase n=1 Tax=uncultured microorganism TaxID=358574 RepID=K0J8N6_9ZZZZ|nr:endopeptidase [uncultured microorganism]
MAKAREHPEPLTSQQVARLEPLPPEEKPPETLTVNLGTFRVPEGTKTSIVSVKEVSDTFQLQATLPGDAIGRRIPYDSIAAEPLDKTRLEEIARVTIPDSGLRPLHLPVYFQPGKVKLQLGEIAHPPFDFEYKPGVDRPTNVFAPDDRYIYRDTSFPWCTVGRVDTPLGSGTGCTIGSQLLLTANHCIQWNADGTAGWVRFRPACYNASAPFGEAWATLLIHWIRTTPADGLTDRETAFDYVVCVLDSRIGDIVGYPGYRTYNDDWNGDNYWQHMGYPQDLSGTARPAFQGECVISTVSTERTSGQTGYVLGHFNDIVGGHSGGPVWGWWSGEPWPRVVGTQSAEANVPANNTAGDNEFGGGPALSSLISWARAHYS